MTMPDSPGRHFSPHLVAGLQRVQLVLTFLSGVTAAIAHPFSIVLHGIRDSVTSTFSVSAPWAIQASYYLRVALLTTVAYLTGRSFIIPRHNDLPRFIARPGNQDLHPFPLNLPLIFEIYIATGHTPVCPAARTWRTGPRVRSRLHGSIFFNTPPLETLPLLPRTLVGNYLTQEQGLIGHEYCFALLEEYGEGPGGQIMGRAYSWIHGREVNVGIPRSFFPSPDIDENNGFHFNSPTLEELCFADPFENGTLFQNAHPAIFANPDDDDEATIAEEGQPPEDSEDSDDDGWDVSGAQTHARLQEKEGTLAAIDLAYYMA